MVDVKGLDPRFAPSVRLSSVRFLTYTGKEVERISCKRITNPNTFDSLLHPNKGGLYDLALGPCDQQEICGTCGLNGVHCPGHTGHIPIPLPVYHPVFFSTLFALLKISCWNCCRLFCSPFRAHMLIGQLELVELGLLSEASAKLMEHEVLGDIDPEDMDNPEKAMAKLTEGAIASKIRAYVERCISEALARGPALRAKTKHLVEMRSILIGNFIKLSSRSAKKCPRCKAPLRSFRQENRSKIFIKGLQRKAAMWWRNCRITELKERRKLEREFREGVVLEEDITEEVQCPSEESLMKSSYVSPLEMRDHITRLWSNEKSLVNAIIGCCEVAKSAVGVDGVEEGVGQSLAASEDVSPADVFFLEVIPVPPSRFRPIAQLGEKRFENPQTVNLQRILQDTIEIEQLLAERKTAQLEEEGAEQGVESAAGEGAREQGKNKKVNGGSIRKKLSLSERLQICWLKLQNNVNCLMDSTSDKTAKVAPNGIKQILEKKDGLFRKHMMGKRVDFAARSVISPDPYINMDEIGIPMVFALKLTYPQPVTDWNVEELRQAVINGPNTYPGATHVQQRDGSVVLLSSSDPLQRVSLAETLSSNCRRDMAGARQKVFRHLKNGDVLLMNRQPTLHKPSIMAHKARILPGEKTLRLHYANCKTYNADFDGDEMNAHFPQNELARAEAYTIVSTHHQYLVPKDGTPLSGLIQDHVVSGLLMTIRGNMFSRSDYMHLVFSALPDHPTAFHTLPPCMRKPQLLWSGKQVVSTLLLNIAPHGMEKLNLNSRAKISVKEWGRGNPGVSSPSKWTRKMRRRMKYYPDSMSESEVVFCEGELMCGVLDKSQFGASQYGFVHSCHELYGGAVANMLLSALGRLFTTYLQLRGFTLGVEDILVRPEAEEERRELMSKCVEHGPEATAEALGIDTPENTELVRKQYEKAHRSTDPNAMKMLDYFMKKKTDHYNNSINAYV